MATECTQKEFAFHPLRHREIRAQFDGGAITTEGGGLLLREVEKRIGIVRQFAACFRDYRNPALIEHTVEELVAQRVYGLALGYEDLNDHEELRKDPLLAVLVEKSDPEGEPLAGKSTLNRLELTPETANAKVRYKKIVADHAAVDRLYPRTRGRARHCRLPTWPSGYSPFPSSAPAPADPTRAGRDLLHRSWPGSALARWLA